MGSGDAMAEGYRTPAGVLAAGSMAAAGRSFQLALLTLAVAAAVYARIAVGPLQETMRVALSLSDNQMALLQGPALALPMVMLAIPLGLLIDRYSRVRLVLFFLMLSLLGSVLTAWATSFGALLAARCLTGLMAPAIWTAALSLLADWYEPTQRGRAAMIVAVGGIVGMSAAFAFGGALLGIFSAAPDAWRWAMLWLNVPLLVAVLMTFTMREPARAERHFPRPSAREAGWGLWRHRTVVLPLIAGLSVVGIADGAAVIWAAPTLARTFDLSPPRIGALVGTVLLVSGLLGPVVGGTLTDLSQRAGGPRRAMVLLSALAFLSVPAGLFAVAPGVASMSIPFVLFMTIGAAFNVAVPVLATVVIPNELRGICLSVIAAACLLLGFGLAPLTVSLLSSALGGPALIGRALAIVCATGSALGALAFALGARHFPRTPVVLSSHTESLL
jgi:MFS family permease